ncbi:MAG: HEAT repeat domain-containing protein, partial [Chloroflexota bacterium]
MTSLDHAIQELTSGNETRAEASARSFAVYGPEGINALREMINQPDAESRWWAVRAAAEFDPVEYPEASQLILFGLDDPDSGVQTCAAVALRQRPNPGAIPFLIDLLSAPDQLLRRTVSDALVALEGRAVEALTHRFEAGDDQAIGKTEAVR